MAAGISYSFYIFLPYIETKDYFRKESLLHLGCGQLVFLLLVFYIFRKEKVNCRILI